MKKISYGILLALFWIVLSGHFEPLLLGLGAASIALTMLLARRMNVIDHETHPFHLSTGYPGYFLYLWKEIILANVDVARRILTPGKDAISPQLFDVPLKLKTDLKKVIYANSITLTPGTVSVALGARKIQVHALSREAAKDLSNGQMHQAVQDRVAD